MPNDFIIVNDLVKEAHFDIKYYGKDNFVGTPVDGYDAPLCVLQKRAAEGLVKASNAALKEGYRLKILDCYRPQRAVSHFVRWASNLADTVTKTHYYPNIPKSTLLGPYIAEKSGHSRGATLDVTLEKRSAENTWEPVDMGTPFDFFDPLSHTVNSEVGESVLQNRQRLIRYMQAGNFVNYELEWWHFSQQEQVYPNTYFDFPLQLTTDNTR
ncbi:peptidase M15 [Alteromonas sediminis]|uniref:D-alanyl-D-alanine dipeptidase n=2 Tax=Alteromonas sediminis TaxID=2259342 RepID=A0A3N5Y7L4_9ALTE|nr:peptidase M15 [Alteromonas sediminis]